VHERTAGVDGWASLEVSPLIADDTEATIQQAAALHAKAETPQPLHQDPAPKPGRRRSRKSIFAGVPINVTLLFDDVQYLAAADAYMRGIERRIEAGLSPTSPRSPRFFISRWDVAVAETVPRSSTTGLDRGRRARPTPPTGSCSTPTAGWALENEGARPQRFLWASTGTKDPSASDTLYIEAFASPLTINTMPEPTLHAFADHGEIGDLMPADGGNAEQVLAEFEQAGIDVAALAARPAAGGQRELQQILGRPACTRSPPSRVAAG